MDVTLRSNSYFSKPGSQETEFIQFILSFQIKNFQSILIFKNNGIQQSYKKPPRFYRKLYIDQVQTDIP